MSEITLNVGETLRRIRENKKIPIETVANALNLRLSILIAIEADDPAKQIMEVYRKGYQRAYAKYLEIDPVEILDQTVSPEVIPRDHDEVSLVQKFTESVLMRWWLAIVFLVVAFFTWFSTIKNSQINPLLDNRMSEERVSPPGVDWREPVSSGKEFVRSNGNEVSTNSLDLKNNIIDAGLEGAVSHDSINGEIRISGDDEDHLVMIFSEDCWIELFRADSREVYQDTHIAGDILEFKGGSPYRVKLGYTPGVSLKFNGEIVALAPHTRNNVASIVLGQ